MQNDVRLIDASALLKEFEMRQEQQTNKYCDCFLNDAQELSTEWWCVEDAVTAAPTISAVPVVHGRWEWYEDWGPSTWLEPPDLDKSGWKCSNCGIDLGDYLTDCLGVNVYVDEEDKMPKINSCPNCGAKMDAKEG